MAKVTGPGRLAVRLSPTSIVDGKQNQSYFGATCSDPDAVYEYAVQGLNKYKLAYLNLSEPRWSGRSDGNVAADKGFSQPLANTKYRKSYQGVLMAAGGFTPKSAAKAIQVASNRYHASAECI
jgi:N-ethylmaleimide reductase